MSNRQYFQAISDARKTAERLRSDSEKSIGRLERRIPVYLLMAIICVMTFKAGATSGLVALLFASIMIGCSIHLAYLIREHQKSISKCNDLITRHLKEKSSDNGQFNN